MTGDNKKGEGEEVSSSVRLCLWCLYPNPPGPGDEDQDPNYGRITVQRKQQECREKSRAMLEMQSSNSVVSPRGGRRCWLVLCSVHSEILYPNPPGPGARARDDAKDNYT